jgi:cytochrome c oxidase subunit 2
VSIFRTHSSASGDIETLFWWMLLAATLVFAGAVGFMLLAYLRRRREGLPVLGDSEGAGRGVVVLFGILIPAVVLIGVFTVANFAVAAHTDAPTPRQTRLTVQVVGRQWWWEIRYPERKQAITANELHIPVRTPVQVVVRTADVIHSFWVPELNRKIDLVPGRTNRVEFNADRPGRYEGQCAEYCGLQHAHMRLVVIAQPRAQFDAWLKRAAAPAAAPSGAAAQRGMQAFDRNACASCHQIRGTPADGRVGPDLTHLQERATLAALTIPNTRGELRRWIADPQHVKPGARMPALHLSERDYDDITAYLEGLR